MRTSGRKVVVFCVVVVFMVAAVAVATFYTNKPEFVLKAAVDKPIANNQGVDGTLTIDDPELGISGELHVVVQKHDSRFYYKIEGLRELSTRSVGTKNALYHFASETRELWTQFDSESLEEFFTEVNGSLEAGCGEALMGLLSANSNPFIFKNELSKDKNGAVVYEVATNSEYFNSCYRSQIELHINNGLLSKTLEQITIKTSSTTVSGLDPNGYGNATFTLSLAPVRELGGVGVMTTLSRQNAVMPYLLDELKTALTDELTDTPEFEQRVREASAIDDSECGSYENVRSRLWNEMRERVDERLKFKALLNHEEKSRED